MVNAERWRLVLGLEKPCFACGSAALRAGPADANVVRGTDMLKCADAVEACRLAAAARPVHHRRSAAQRRSYSPSPSRRPPGVVKRYALAASSCLVVVHVPIKGASKRNKERTPNGSNGGPVQ